jgi:hypothetical protein
MARALVLITVLALILALQCDGNCAAAACNLAPTSSDSCPHHRDSSDKQLGCRYLHSEFAGPASIVLKHVLAPINSPLPDFAYRSAFPMSFEIQPGFDSGYSPPFSVLRI